MVTYGQIDGVKFRVRHDGKLDEKTFELINKMVHLTNKATNNGNTKTAQTNNKNQDRI